MRLQPLKSNLSCYSISYSENSNHILFFGANSQQKLFHDTVGLDHTLSEWMNLKILKNISPWASTWQKWWGKLPISVKNSSITAIGNMHQVNISSGFSDTNSGLLLKVHCLFDTSITLTSSKCGLSCCLFYFLLQSPTVIVTFKTKIAGEKPNVVSVKWNAKGKNVFW